METIRDGKGRGFMAGVNSKNRLLVRSTSFQQFTKSSTEGNYFEATTGKVTLTDANEKGIIYLKNDSIEGHLLVVDRVFWDTWPSVNGSGSGTIEYYRNPSVTGGTAIVPNNTLFSMLSQAPVTALKMLTTMTGTEWWTGTVTPPTNTISDEGRIALPPGYTFGISIIPPAGNTSMDISVNVAFYMIDLNDVE